MAVRAWSWARTSGAVRWNTWTVTNINQQFHSSAFTFCGYMWTRNYILDLSKRFWMSQVTLIWDLSWVVSSLACFLSVFSQPLTPCMSPSLKRNCRSLYLGRMFSGVPVVRLRFRRRIQTGWESYFWTLNTFATVVSYQKSHIYSIKTNNLLNGKTV